VLPPTQGFEALTDNSLTEILEKLISQDTANRAAKLPELRDWGPLWATANHTDIKSMVGAVRIVLTGEGNDEGDELMYNFSSGETPATQFANWCGWTAALDSDCEVSFGENEQF
jgi:hypothetical protein